MTKPFRVFIGVNTEGLTNTRGEFSLFAPAGIYEIKVDKNSLPEHVLVPVIQLEVQKRSIEVKKFSSA